MSLLAHSPIEKACDGLVAISPFTLFADEPLNIDIYVRDPSTNNVILFASADQWISERTMAKLAADHRRKLYVDRTQHSTYQSHLTKNINRWLSDDSIPTSIRIAATGEVVREILASSFRTADVPAITSVAQKLGGTIASLIQNTRFGAKLLCDVLHHDYGTFTHSSNVAFYATSLAREIGFCDDDLNDIAVGGMLHDIGKLNIPTGILNKPGKLDDIEFRQIKSHPLVGFAELCKLESVTRTQLLMTYQHHERLDGKGYPVGIGEEEIDITAKICSVVDVFEALTSDRPYRHALSVSRAFEIMEQQSNRALDPEILRCWSKLIRRPSLH